MAHKSSKSSLYLAGSVVVCGYTFAVPSELPLTVAGPHAMSHLTAPPDNSKHLTLSQYFQTWKLV